VSLAKPLQANHPQAYLATLCLLSSLGIAVIVMPRAGPLPLTLWPHITLCALIYAVVVLYGQFTLPLGRFWAEDVVGVLLAGLVAAGAVGVAATVVLPSTASDEVGGEGLGE
jgi:hypothetical protein